jgi:hypothetical protein
MKIKFAGVGMVAAIAWIGCGEPEVSPTPPSQESIAEEDNLGVSQQAIYTCHVAPACPSGTTYNATLNGCTKPTTGCPAYFDVGTCADPQMYRYSKPVRVNDYSGTTDYCHYTEKGIYANSHGLCYYWWTSVDGIYADKITCSGSYTKRSIAGADVCVSSSVACSAFTSPSRYLCNDRCWYSHPDCGDCAL